MVKLNEEDYGFVNREFPRVYRKLREDLPASVSNEQVKQIALAMLAIVLACEKVRKGEITEADLEPALA